MPDPIAIAGLCSRYGHTDVLEILLSKSLDVDQTDNAGDTSLQLARRHGNDAAVRLLEEHDKN